MAWTPAVEILAGIELLLEVGADGRVDGVIHGEQPWAGQEPATLRRYTLAEQPR